MNNYPIELLNDPLVIATVEIRFNAELNPEEAFSHFYKLFSHIFPDIRNKYPITLQSTPIALHPYSSEYLFSNESFKIGLSNKVLTFENNKKYSLWKNYFPFIKEISTILNENTSVKKIVRIGIRYASIFENYNSIDEVIKMTFTLPDIVNGKQNNLVYKSDLIIDGKKVVLQIIENLEVKSSLTNDEKKRGVYIDIDVSIDKELPNEINHSVFEIIDDLHSLEKKIFFELLKPEIISSLNPKF